jgi:LGFP repeat
MTVSGGRYTVAGFYNSLPVQGWLRKIGATPTDFYLVKLTSNPTVYWVQSGRRYGIVSQSVLDTMQASGLRGWNGGVIETSTLPGTVGPTFVAQNSGSNGLLLRQTGTTTVYVVHNGRRQPFTSHDALRWFDQDWFAHVIDVPASLLTNFTLDGGLAIYGIGEGASDGATGKQAYRDAYTRLKGRCGTSTWSGWPLSFATCLEFPQSAVLQSATSGASAIGGDYQNFGNDTTRLGGIVRSARGTFGVWGAIYTKWASLGYSGSWLGFPTSDEYPWGANPRSDFEGGYISWNSTTNQTTEVRNAPPPVVITGLTANVTFPVAVNTPIRWTATATGGNAPLQYIF